MGLFSRKKIDPRRTAGPGRALATALSIEECVSTLMESATWWKAPYPDMPFCTPAGVVSIGTEPPPSATWAFELTDDSPGLLAVWHSNSERDVAFFAPGSRSSGPVLDDLMNRWKALDSSARDLGSRSGESLRYVEPPVPDDLLEVMLEWCGLSPTSNNLAKAAENLLLMIAIKTSELKLPPSSGAAEPGLMGLIRREVKYLSMTNPAVAPFAQRVHWRQAALGAMQCRELLERGEVPLGFEVDPR